MSRILIALCSFIALDAVAIEFIAHRGYSCGTLENTVLSVSNAWLVGSDGVELDLRVSKDGVVFLYHDDKIDGRSISKLDYAEVNSAVEIGAPTFESILNLGEPPGYFVLDLKEMEPGKYESLARLISASAVEQSHFVIQSTSEAVLAALKEQLPDAKFYYLTHLKRTFPLYRAPKSNIIVARIEGFNVDGVSLKGRGFIDQRFIQDFKGAGYLVNVWTINDPARASYYRDIGVDGLITDFVEQVRSEVIDGKIFEGQCLGAIQDAN
jgi:glycerophosphoryl diester phosphodiesterase